MNQLMPIFTYDVEEKHLEKTQLQVTVPIRWLRARTKPGKKIGLYQDPATGRLMIEEVERLEATPDQGAKTEGNRS